MLYSLTMRNRLRLSHQIDKLIDITGRGELRRVLNTGNVEALRDSEHGEGILLNAIRYRNQALIHILIEENIQINAPGLYGVTPLMLACAEDSKRLILRGATVDDVDSEGRSALMYAVEAADLDKVAYLVAQGANTQIRDSAGQAAADYADALGFSLPGLK